MDCISPAITSPSKTPLNCYVVKRFVTPQKSLLFPCHPQPRTGDRRESSASDMKAFQIVVLGLVLTKRIVTEWLSFDTGLRHGWVAVRKWSLLAVVSCPALCRSWSESEIVLVYVCEALTTSVEVLPVRTVAIGGGGPRTGLSPFCVVGPCMKTEWLTPRSRQWSYIWELIMQTKHSLSETFLRSQWSSELLKTLHRNFWRPPGVSLNSAVLWSGQQPGGRSGSWCDNFDKSRISIWAEGVFEEKQQRNS